MFKKFEVIIFVLLLTLSRMKMLIILLQGQNVLYIHILNKQLDFLHFKNAMVFKMPIIPLIFFKPTKYS